MKSLVLIILFIAGICFAQENQGQGDSRLKPFFPEAPSSEQSLVCGLGDSAGCLPIDHSTLTNLNACTETLKIAGPVSDIGFLLLNRYADTTFFQELANRSVQATDCQLKILEPSKRNELTRSAWQVYQAQQHLLKKLVEREKQLQDEHDGFALAAADPRTGSTAIQARNRINEQLSSLRSTINDLLGHVPFGNLEATRSALRGIAGKITSEDEFKRIYNQSLDANISDLRDGLNTFLEVRNNETGYFDLSLGQKIELYNSTGAQKLIDRLDPERKSLGCLFDKCYKDGPRNVQVAAVAALIGATVLSGGSSAPFVAAVTTLGSAGLGIQSIHNSCFRDTLAINTEVQASCTPEAVTQTTISKVKSLECASQIALSLLEGVPSGIVVSKAITTRRVVQNLDTAAVTVERTGSNAGVLSRIPAHEHPGQGAVRDLRPQTQTYPKIVRDLDLEKGHTIHNIPGYLDENLGVALRRSADEGKAEVRIVQGDLKDLQSFVEQNKLLWLEDVPNPSGFHKVSLMQDPDGKKIFVISAANGEDRLVHILSLLKMANVPEKSIQVVGSKVNWRSHYVEQFENLGTKPDAVVVGFANTVVEQYITKAGAKADEFKRAYLTNITRKKTKAPAGTHELDGMAFHELKFSDGKTVWIMNNEYGERAGDLIDALQDYGVKDITYLGTAGAVNPSYKVGTIVTPEISVSDAGTVKGISSLEKNTGTHAHVASPNIETMAWLDSAKKDGIDYVEVELNGMLNRVRPGTEFKPYLVISDVIGSSHDYTSWGDAGAQAFITQMMPRINQTLGQQNGQLVSYSIHPLLSKESLRPVVSSKTFTGSGQAAQVENFMNRYVENLDVSPEFRQKLAKQEFVLNAEDSTFVAINTAEGKTIAGFRMYDGKSSDLPLERFLKEKEATDPNAAKIRASIRENANSPVFEIGRLFIEKSVSSETRRISRHKIYEALHEYCLKLLDDPATKNAVIYASPQGKAQATLFSQVGFKEVASLEDGSIYQSMGAAQLKEALERLLSKSSSP